MTKPAIIAITGPAGSGKDEVCKAFYTLKDGGRFVNHLAFASRIKRIAWIITGWSDEYMTEHKEDIDNKFGFSPRQLFQILGTEFGRDMLGQDIWIKAIARDIEQNQHETVVITDLRFENEAEYIKSIGGVIWEVEREDLPEVRSHSSENGIPKEYVDFTIKNNGTLEELKAEVGKVLGQTMLKLGKDLEGRDI